MLGGAGVQGVAAGHLGGHAVEEADRTNGPHRPTLEGSVREAPVVRTALARRLWGGREGRAGEGN